MPDQPVVTPTVRAPADLDTVAGALRQDRRQLVVDAKVVETEPHRYRGDLLAGALASAGRSA